MNRFTDKHTLHSSNKLTSRLTVMTFLLLLLLSSAISLFAYGCIWFFLPGADLKRAQRSLDQETQQLISSLWTTCKSDSEPLFTDFIRRTGAELLLLDHEKAPVSFYSFEKIHAAPIAGNRYPFRFKDSSQEYLLITRCHPARTDEIQTALRRSIPFAAVLIVLLSALCAFVFSRSTTRPIIQISAIADRIASLDFSWYCPYLRDDEIGVLSRSINELSDRLHAALEEIQRRNTLLSDELLLEKEHERRRMLFFSGVSHELKTPIAVVIGQLEGMQANVGVYRDRDKYLARSAEILQSLNHFIQEMLLVSHMDLSDEPALQPVGLAALVEALTAEYAKYAQPLFIDIHLDIRAGNPAKNPVDTDAKAQDEFLIRGDEMLLKKALGNVIGNAVTHSPKHQSVSVALSRTDGWIQFTVQNTGVHIDENHLPHLFEAFYRADKSARYGSGLGLYITRMILDTYHVRHTIENVEDGVRFTACFPADASGAFLHTIST